MLNSIRHSNGVNQSLVRLVSGSVSEMQASRLVISEAEGHVLNCSVAAAAAIAADTASI